ncbi:MAG: FitA-like ribbon-helix-helix domain-containing protein, partial [Actinomycetes bacterium]
AMAKMVQVRNVPDDVHQELAKRARAAGSSLSEYLLRELREIAARPSLDDVLELAEIGASATFSFDEIAEIIRRDRESH